MNGFRSLQRSPLILILLMINPGMSLFRGMFFGAGGRLPPQVIKY
jgi:hypothetical protein